MNEFQGQTSVIFVMSYFILIYFGFSYFTSHVFTLSQSLIFISPTGAWPA